MPFLELEILGNSLAKWAEALGAGALALGLLWAARRVLAARLGALAARTTNSWDDLVVLLVRRTKTLTLAVTALWPALALLAVPPPVGEVARIITVLVGGVQLAIWGNLLIAHVLEARVAQMRAADPASATTLNGLTILARIVLWVVLVLLALDNLGVNISALVAGLGIGGVAIALAIQNILGDLFASLSIVLDKPFVVGDFIVIGDLMGTVEHVGLKTTRVRSLSGEQLVFANADLLGSRIRNFKRMSERRVLFTLGVTYQTPSARLSAIPEILREIIAANQGVRFDRAHFKSYDDSALTFEIVYYVLDPDYNRYMDTQQRINLEIYRRFEREGIEFAYPTHTVYLRSEPGEGEGQASRAA
jgi:small-conductance mechanosensitive channel